MKSFALLYEELKDPKYTGLSLHEIREKLREKRKKRNPEKPNKVDVPVKWGEFLAALELEDVAKLYASPIVSDLRKAVEQGDRAVSAILWAAVAPSMSTSTLGKTEKVLNQKAIDPKYQEYIEVKSWADEHWPGEPITSADLREALRLIGKQDG